MGIVGVYIMLFARTLEIDWLNIAGTILATVGFIFMAHFEDCFNERIKRIEKKVKQ